MGIKENWEKKDEVCPHCNQVTKLQRGITRQNVKRLFSIKFSFTEFLITFMLIMLIVLTVSYKNETKESREWISKMYSTDKEACEISCLSQCQMYYSPENNFSNSKPQTLNLSDG